MVSSEWPDWLLGHEAEASLIDISPDLLRPSHKLEAKGPTRCSAPADLDVDRCRPVQWAHSVTSDAQGMSGNLACDNFFLSQTGATDVDIHGSPGAENSSWARGISGDHFDVGWNTFLATTHLNINQRGTRAVGTAKAGRPFS